MFVISSGASMSITPSKTEKKPKMPNRPIFSRAKSIVHKYPAPGRTIISTKMSLHNHDSQSHTHLPYMWRWTWAFARRLACPVQHTRWRTAWDTGWMSFCQLRQSMSRLRIKRILVAWAAGRRPLACFVLVEEEAYLALDGAKHRRYKNERWFRHRLTARLLHRTFPQGIRIAAK